MEHRNFIPRQTKYDKFNEPMTEDNGWGCGPQAGVEYILNEFFDGVGSEYYTLLEKDKDDNLILIIKYV